MSDDRRKDTRIDVDGKMTLGPKGEDVAARVINVSRAGALVVSPRPMNVMDALSLRAEFDCQDQGVQSFGCEAVVVRCSRRSDGQFDIGLFFTVIEPAEQERLERIRLAASGAQSRAR